jgi:hypothetical protein
MSATWRSEAPALGRAGARGIARSFREDLKTILGDQAAAIHASAVGATIHLLDGCFDIAELADSPLLLGEQELTALEVTCDIGGMLRRRRVLASGLRRRRQILSVHIDLRTERRPQML